MEYSNKRIATNAIMLYVRMFLSTIVGLYTSRVVLQVLGVEDYGIYGIVGSVVGMMGFINASMSGATSRFISYELGTGNKKTLNETFSSALIIHIFIALLIIIICETLGLWFLCNKLVIPLERLNAAHWVFHLSILSAAISITQPPYSACIMAHERMDIYAYYELLHVILKLLIVFVIQYFDYDKLIFYAILVVSVTIIMQSLYRIYCVRHFEESHFRWVWNKPLLKSLLSFSGWDLFGNLSVTTKQQGINFLINIFFGVIYNAASGVASTVQGIILSLCHNLLSAFRPQIIKQYAANNSRLSINLIYNSAKFSTLLFVLISIPLFFEMNFIMHLWLGSPPEYASIFCRIMLVSSCLNIFSSSINIGIIATGKMKLMSFLTGLFYFSVIPILWISYYFGLPVESAYYVSVFANVFIIIIRTSLLHKYIAIFDIKYLLFNIVLPILSVAFIVSILVKVVTNIYSDGLFRCFLAFLVSFGLGGLLTFNFLFSREQQKKILSILLSRIRQ